MSNIAIKVEHISKEYQIGHSKSGDLRDSFGNKLGALFTSKQQTETFTALDDVSFEINQGEAVGIIGQNGAGKSTLLKILSRITEPTKGRFEINGRVSSLLEVGTGFHPELSGRENIYLNGTILGMKRAEIKTKFDEIIAFSEIEKFIDTPVKHYSSGMKVRLAFSVAAHLEPEILLIDEVLAVGDIEFQRKCLGKMEDVTGLGRTVLFVSHDMSAVQNLCDSGIILRKNKATYFDRINDAIANYNSGITKFLKGVNSFKINDDIIIDNVNINNKEILSTQSLKLDFSIQSVKPNIISDLSILFYNQLNQRVAIADLRNYDILEKSKFSQKIDIEVSLQKINFISGYYTIGLYLSSQLFSGDFYNIADFYLNEELADNHQYESKYRGFINLKFTCNVK